MIPEQAKIAYNIPFGYIEQDVVIGIERTRSKLKDFQESLVTPNEDHELAQRVVNRYNNALGFADELGNKGIIDLLEQIYQQVSELEQQGVDSKSIARQIEQERPGAITQLRDIMHKGWIEPLFQSVVAVGYEK